jgi:hypothetical protein
MIRMLTVMACSAEGSEWAMQSAGIMQAIEAVNVIDLGGCFCTSS